MQQADDSHSYERPRKNKEKSYIKPPEDGRPIIKPVSGTIYDRPRVAPRINLPVPKNAADKFAYKPIGAPTTPDAKLANEEYDDYEEITPQPAASDKKPASSRLSTSKIKEQDDDSQISSPSKSKFGVSSASDGKNTTQNSEEDYEDNIENSSKTLNTISTTTEPPVNHSPMPVIRKFKRPFLPSRGGNPYSARNLQSVGTKAKDDTQEIDLGESSLMKSVADPAEIIHNNDEIQDTNPDFRQNPVEVKNPSVSKITITTAEESTLRSAVQGIGKEEIKPGVIRIKVPIRVKPYLEQEESKSQNLYGKYSISESTTTTEQTKLAKEDILNGNYDVSLNEAISPIIPNLPVRSFGGYNPATDYTYKRFQRPTKYVILDPVVSAGNTYYVR